MENLDLRIKEKNVRYAYGKPEDLALIFSIARDKLKFYRHNFDHALLIRLPSGGVFYEFSGNASGTFLQIVNKMIR